MKLIFECKCSYGNSWFYPVCDDSKFICQLMDRKALKPSQIDEIKGHGWEIVLK